MVDRLFTIKSQSQSSLRQTQFPVAPTGNHFKITSDLRCIQVLLLKLIIWVPLRALQLKKTFFVGQLSFPASHQWLPKVELPAASYEAHVRQHHEIPRVYCCFDAGPVADIAAVNSERSESLRAQVSSN